MPITHFTGMSEPARLCRREALECQSTALASTDLRVRLTYLHLAKLWREMADEAERQTKEPSACEERGIVVFLDEFQKSRAIRKPDIVIVPFPEKPRL
jgi:hypothetical protein